ncbi:transposase [Planctomycetales bacterium ZRK34]|nr:transposase [Planctomycetales bacterium ZRK34]
MHWFLSLADAREKIAAWHEDYNTIRPHSSLNNLTPEQFATRCGPTVPAAPPPLAHTGVSCLSTLSGCA